MILGEKFLRAFNVRPVCFKYSCQTLLIPYAKLYFINCMNERCSRNKRRLVNYYFTTYSSG